MPPLSAQAASFHQPLTGRPLVRTGEIVRTVLRKHLPPWRRLLQLCDVRVADHFADMNVHMLKDVGAPDWLIDRATEERRQQQAAGRYLRRTPMV